MNVDAYDCVINGEETYAMIALLIRANHSVAIAWTDGFATQYDIVFSTPVLYGPLQGGAGRGRGQESRYLFVSIARKGCFGFAPGNDDLHPGYIEEKLGVTGETTKAQVATLISEVRKRLG